jgi:hypothetical protein
MLVHFLLYPELVVKRLHRGIIENPHGFYVCAVNPEFM